MDPARGLGRISVQILALSVHVLSHHAPSRASLTPKARQRQFVYGEELSCMQKTRIGHTWFSTLMKFFVPRELGQNGVSDQVLVNSAPFL